VSLFESKNAEHIIPEQLFLWRLCALENVLKQRANDPTGLKIIASYIPYENEEDPEFIEYEAEVIEYAPCDEKSDENVKKSGFECLVVSWGDDNELLSPWEVTIPDPTFSSPSPLPLSSAEKRAVANTLHIIEGNEKFKAFTSPVNTLRYPDYLARVEVPMDTGRIRTRLGADYYVSLSSVLSDVILIRENCKKYNGLDEMASLATELFNTFKDLMKGELDRLGVDHESMLETEEDMDCTETRSSMNSSNAEKLEHLNSFPPSAKVGTESIDNVNERQNGNPVNLLTTYANGDESGKLDVSIMNNQFGQESRFYESSTFAAKKKHRTSYNEIKGLDVCNALEDTSDSEGESYHEEIQNERKSKRIHRSKRRSSSMTRSVLELNAEFDSSHSKYPRSRRSKNSSEVLSALVSLPTNDVRPLRTRNGAKQSNLIENKEKTFDEGVVSRRPNPCFNRFEEVGEYQKQSTEYNGDERLNSSPIKREQALKIKAGLLDSKTPRRLSSKCVGSKSYKDDVHDNDSEIFRAESYHRGQSKSLQKEEASTEFGEIAERELNNKMRLRPTRACKHLNYVHDDQSKPEIRLKQSPTRKSSRHQVVKSEDRLSDSCGRSLRQTKKKYKEDTSEEELEGKKSALPKGTRQSSRGRRLCKPQDQTTDNEDEKPPKEHRRTVLTHSKSKHAASSDESETFSDVSSKPRRRNPSRGQQITSFKENDETSEEDGLASHNDKIPHKDRPQNYKAVDDQANTGQMDSSYHFDRRTRGRGGDRDRSVSTLAVTTKECESFQDSSSNASDYASETSPDESEHNEIEDIPCKKVSLSHLPKVPNELVVHDFNSEYNKELENDRGEIVDTRLRTLRPRGLPKILIEETILSENNEIQGNLKIEEKHEVALSHDKPRRVRSNRSPMHIGSCDLESAKDNSLHDHKSRLRTRKRQSVEVVSSNNAESTKEIKRFRKKSRNTGFKSCIPERSRWPKVPLRKISLIAKSILSELRKLDTEGNFNGPVTDLFPEIRDSYFSMISTPMDFTTIESEMLPNYESIFEFEENLILVFENCIQFNGDKNPFGLFAISMLEQLNDIFQRVCHENGVRLPGNWNQH
jgi:Bromodomain